MNEQETLALTLELVQQANDRLAGVERSFGLLTELLASMNSRLETLERWARDIGDDVIAATTEVTAVANQSNQTLQRNTAALEAVAVEHRRHNDLMQQMFDPLLN